MKSEKKSTEKEGEEEEGNELDPFFIFWVCLYCLCDMLTFVYHDDQSGYLCRFVSHERLRYRLSLHLCGSSPRVRGPCGGMETDLINLKSKLTFNVPQSR